MNWCSKYHFWLNVYKKKHQQVHEMLSKRMSETTEAYTSIALDFLVFYIESKQEISFIYLLHIFIEVNGTCLNSNCLWLFSTWLLFSEWVFLIHLNISCYWDSQTLGSWFKKQKFKDENGNFNDVSGADAGCFWHRYTNFGYTNLGVPRSNLKLNWNYC